MRKYFKLLLVLILIFILSCENNSQKIVKLLNSNDKTDIIRGCSLLNSEKDSAFVKYLFKNLNDERISHEAKFYGISVYSAKIKALKRISGLEPPNMIIYKNDSINTNFYRRWAIDKGFIEDNQ